jgi:hypothetical protein
VICLASLLLHQWAWSSFVDGERLTFQLGCMKPLNRCFRVQNYGHLEESKSRGDFVVAIPDNVDKRYFTERPKRLPKIIFGYVV